MSNYEFKKIGDVDVIESVSDLAHVIIEDSGILKKMAAKNIGAVKSVNGTEPDENGNVVVQAGVQPDWNQNDSTAADYVKNRTHYDAGSEVEIELMPSTDLTFELYEGKMDFYSDEVDFVIEEGKKYLITIDGEEYIDTAVSFENFITLGESMAKLELSSQMGVSVTYNRPYIILYRGYFEIIMLTSTETTHNVSISKIDSLVHKEIYNELNTKFDYVNGQYGKYLFDMDTPIVGLNYTVIWDGTEYICKAFSPMEGIVFFGNLAAFGEEDTGEPFMFVSQGGMTNAFMDIVNRYTPEETKTINVSVDKQLDDGTYESIIASADRELTYDSDMSVYMSTPVDSMLELGATYKVIYNSTEYICVCVELNGIPSIGNPTINPLFASYENSGEPFLIGYNEAEGLTIYSSAEVPAVYHDVKLSGYISGVKKLDKKYIPVASETEAGIVKVCDVRYDISNNSNYCEICLDSKDNRIYARKPDIPTIRRSTTDLTEGVSSLATGEIYLVYE